MARILAPAVALVGAAGSLLSIVTLPWALYGGIDIPLDRFPGWEVYAASVLVLHACVAWTLLAPASRRRVPLVLALVAGLFAAGSTIVLALRYDDAGAFFAYFVPMVWPSPGPGPAVALLAIVVSVGAVLLLSRNSRDAGTPPRPRS